MASAKHCPSPRTNIVDKLPALLGRQPLMPVVVDHDDRRAVAGAEALHFHQREHPVGGGLTRVDSELRAQFLGYSLRAEERARERTAHVQYVLADRLRVEH